MVTGPGGSRAQDADPANAWAAQAEEPPWSAAPQNSSREALCVSALGQQSQRRLGSAAAPMARPAGRLPGARGHHLRLIEF